MAAFPSKMPALSLGLSSEFAADSHPPGTYLHFRCPPTSRSLLSSPCRIHPSSHHLPLRCSFSYQTRRCRFLAMSAKKSPKRLKYSTPRFSKEDPLLYVQLDPSGANYWKLEDVATQLKEGAVGVIPTDTVYAMVCDVNHPDAIDRLRRIKNIEESKPLSILCRSFHDIDVYTTGFPRGDNHGNQDIFRAVKHCLPGPYTFIMTASKQLPRRCIHYGTTAAKYATRKTIGVRIPNDPVCKALLNMMDAPLFSTSVKSPKEDEWILDPIVISDAYGPEGLDFVVDGGVRIAEPSTVVDMTGSIPRVIRRGKGPVQPWMVDGEDEEA